MIHGAVVAANPASSAPPYPRAACWHDAGPAPRRRLGSSVRGAPVHHDEFPRDAQPVQGLPQGGQEQFQVFPFVPRGDDHGHVGGAGAGTFRRAGTVLAHRISRAAVLHADGDRYASRGGGGCPGAVLIGEDLDVAPVPFPPRASAISRCAISRIASFSERSYICRQSSKAVSRWPTLAWSRIRKPGNIMRAPGEAVRDFPPVQRLLVILEFQKVQPPQIVWKLPGQGIGGDPLPVDRDGVGKLSGDGEEQSAVLVGIQEMGVERGRHIHQLIELGEPLLPLDPGAEVLDGSNPGQVGRQAREPQERRPQDLGAREEDRLGRFCPRHRARLDPSGGEDRPRQAPPRRSPGRPLAPGAAEGFARMPPPARLRTRSSEITPLEHRNRRSRGARRRRARRRSPSVPACRGPTTGRSRRRRSG